MLIVILIFLIPNIYGQNISELVKEAKIIDNLIECDEMNVIVDDSPIVRINEENPDKNRKGDSSKDKLQKIVKSKVFRLCDYMIKEPSFSQKLDDSEIYKAYKKPFAYQFGIFLNTLYSLVGEKEFIRNKFNIDNFLKYFNNENPVDYKKFKFNLDERLRSIMVNLHGTEKKGAHSLNKRPTHVSASPEKPAVPLDIKKPAAKPTVIKKPAVKATVYKTPASKATNYKNLGTKKTISKIFGVSTTPTVKATLNKTLWASSSVTKRPGVKTTGKTLTISSSVSKAPFVNETVGKIPVISSSVPSVKMSVTKVPKMTGTLNKTPWESSSATKRPSVRKTGTKVPTVATVGKIPILTSTIKRPTVTKTSTNVSAVKTTVSETPILTSSVTKRPSVRKTGTKAPAVKTVGKTLAMKTTSKIPSVSETYAVKTLTKSNTTINQEQKYKSFVSQKMTKKPIIPPTLNQKIDTKPSIKTNAGVSPKTNEGNLINQTSEGNLSKKINERIPPPKLNEVTSKLTKTSGKEITKSTYKAIPIEKKIGAVTFSSIKKTNTGQPKNSVNIGGSTGSIPQSSQKTNLTTPAVKSNTETQPLVKKSNSLTKKPNVSPPIDKNLTNTVYKPVKKTIPKKMRYISLEDNDNQNAMFNGNYKLSELNSKKETVKNILKKYFKMKMTDV